MRIPTIIFISVLCIGARAGEADNFTFDDNGRRDPFALPKQKMKKEEPPKRPRVDVLAFRNAAELAFVEGRYADARETSLAGLEVIAKNETVGGEEASVTLMRIEKAASRMEERARAEAEFHTLKVRVSGLLTRDGKTLAIVNSQIVTRGELIFLGDKVEAVVEQIRADHVVLEFRGYRMICPIGGE